MHAVLPIPQSRAIVMFAENKLHPLDKSDWDTNLYSLFFDDVADKNEENNTKQKTPKAMVFFYINMLKL